MIKHYLASANTGKKFLCKFDEILNHNKKEFLYIIKGGSGTGKSTLMKRVGRYFEDLNEDVEYFYCSSDPKSLDGVRIKDRNIALVDGTAPHVMETKMLGVKDKIIDVGQFVDINIGKYQDDISKSIIKKTNCFTKLNNYLESANRVMENNLIILKDKVRQNLIKQECDKIFENLNLKQEGFYKRELFLNSLEADFCKLNSYKTEVQLKLSLYENHLVLSGLSKKLEKSKVKFIVFLNIISPDIIDAIEVDDIVIKNVPNNDFLLKNQKGEIEKNDKLISNLVDCAKDCLVNARKNHLKIEEKYILNMDFKKLDLVFEKLIEEMVKF